MRKRVCFKWISAFAGTLVLTIVLCPSAYAADPTGNIQLEVPSQIQYQISSSGSLITPSSSVLAFKNNSSFETRIAAVRFAASSDYNIVDDASESSLPNSISIKIGTANEKIDLSKCTGAKKDVSNEGAWLMSSEDVDVAASTLPIATEGYAANVRDVGTVGSVEWYVVSDTVTNQILNRLDSLEAADTQLQSNIDDKADKDEAVKNITRSGTTFTATRTDDTTFTFDQKDDNATYSASTSTGLNLSGSNVFSIGTVPVANGGTGATSASAARSNLGAASASDLASASYTSLNNNISSRCDSTTVSSVSEYVRWSQYGRVVVIDFRGITFAKTGTYLTLIPSDVVPVPITRPVVYLHCDMTRKDPIACVWTENSNFSSTIKTHVFEAGTRCYGQMVYLTNAPS